MEASYASPHSEQSQAAAKIANARVAATGAVVKNVLAVANWEQVRNRFALQSSSEAALRRSAYSYSPGRPAASSSDCLGRGQHCQGDRSRMKHPGTPHDRGLAVEEPSGSFVREILSTEASPLTQRFWRLRRYIHGALDHVQGTPELQGCGWPSRTEGQACTHPTIW